LAYGKSKKLIRDFPVFDQNFDINIGRATIAACGETWKFGCQFSISCRTEENADYGGWLQDFPGANCLLAVALF
jgi:hypothetical protein